jgi:hypothetical protein
MLRKPQLTLDLLISLLSLTLLLDMESEVLEQENLTVFTAIDSLLDVLSNTVVEELNVLLEELG